MSQKTRREQILHILAEQEYATVKELVSLLGYSAATINRDLNALDALKLVKRSYGGVEAVKGRRLPPIAVRYDYKKREKMKIGRAAASLIETGDSVFIDGSTTAGYIGPFLEKRQKVKVITNNMRLAMELSEKGIEVVCLGGKVVERPCSLDGAETVENAMRYHVNKAFFSSGAFTENGVIVGGEVIYRLLHRVMIHQSDKVYFLADSSKICQKYSVSVCTFDEVDGVISDFSFSDEIKRAFPKTEFLCVKK